MLQVELSKQKIQEIKQRIKKLDSIFSKKKYLESLGSHNFIIGPQNKAEEKLVKLLHLSKNGFSFHFVSVFGKNGTGKSTDVKFVYNNLTEVSSCFVDLRTADTHKSMKLFL